MIFTFNEGDLVSRSVLSKAVHFMLMQDFIVASFLRDHEWPRLKSLTSAVRAEGAGGMSAWRMTEPKTIADTLVTRPLSTCV